MQAAFELISNMQSDTPKDAKQRDLEYLMAYNDGVLDMAVRLNARMDVLKYSNRE